MKPRYVVVCPSERDKFEKEWQMPYGYILSFPTFNPHEAISLLYELVDKTGDVDKWIVEKISDEGRELYYRI